MNDFEKILVEGELDDNEGDDRGEVVAFLLFLVSYIELGMTRMRLSDS